MLLYKFSVKHHATLIFRKEMCQPVSFANNLYILWISKLPCSVLSLAYIKGGCTVYEFSALERF